ncbi:hypothetical protein JD969_17970 [Planctomycetota bacterium]|nr:hypothetical protein JD969_17970 [Planctomycetota bacterium]
MNANHLQDNASAYQSFRAHILGANNKSEINHILTEFCTTEDSIRALAPQSDLDDSNNLLSIPPTTTTTTSTIFISYAAC